MTRTPAFWITPVLLALFAPQATTASDITLTGCIERLDKTGAGTAPRRRATATHRLPLP